MKAFLPSVLFVLLFAGPGAQAQPKKLQYEMNGGLDGLDGEEDELDVLVSLALVINMLMPTTELNMLSSRRDSSCKTTAWISGFRKALSQM